MTRQTSPDAAAGPGAPARTGLILAACCLGQFLSVFDGSVLNVALPSIEQALGFDGGNLHWVINAFMIPSVGFILLAGRLSDLYGQRRIFLGGIALFTVASLLGGLAVDVPTLIAARAVQGLGAAIMVPATLAVLSATFVGREERARAFGLWAAVSGAGGSVGVLSGGVITEWLSWRGVLLVAVPLGIALYVCAAASVPERRDPRGGSLDALGAVTISGALLCLVYGAAESGPAGLDSPQVLIALGLAVVLTAVFLVDQARWAAHPLVPLSIFRNRSVTCANLVMTCAGLAMASTFYFFTLTLQEILGYGPWQAGLAYLPMTVGIMVGAAGCAGFLARYGARPVALVGIVVCIVGLGWFATVQPDASFVGTILPATTAFGLGLGLTLSASTHAGSENLPAHTDGLASGLLNTTDRFGGAAGLALLVGVSVAVTGPGATAPEALLSGYRWAFAATAVAMALALVPALLLPRSVAVDGTPAEASA